MKIEALVFDLGGVVIDIDFNRIFDKWSLYSGIPSAHIRAGFKMDEIYQQHERGEIKGFDYYQHLRGEIGLDINYPQFCEGWNDIMIAPIANTIEQLAFLHGRIPLYALSNANTLHKNYWQVNFQQALCYFDKIYVSSDLGARKPEPAAYEAVAAKTGISLSRLAFFDDLADNVAMAKNLGMHAVQVKSPRDIIKFLEFHRLGGKEV